ncbi:MAG TPA: PQQ-binding-like beta-propeller repeat protein [Vicinamibacterales bacterium]|nr:PQQ-binding-like beta-propeller repeat protein [Vicinamibacterales bacterium]
MIEPLLAQEWPQWRGPSRDGRVDALAVPASWPGSLTRSWTLRVGEGHASPVVASGRVFVFSRETGREVVRALALATGAELWRNSYVADYAVMPEASSHSAGPKATPLVDDQRLYTFGISGVLSCFDIPTGTLRWRIDTARQFDKRPLVYGMSVSPLLYRDLLIVHVGHEKRGALVAFDAATGKERWRWDGGSPSHASPVIIDVAGVSQIVCLSYRSIVGIAAESGALLWQIPHAAVNMPHAVTPVIYRDTFLVSGFSQGITAFRILKRADGWTTEEVWKNSALSISMATPVVSGDLLFGLADRKMGQFFCLDARTGETKWTSTGREGETAALLATDRHLLVLKEDGSLVIARTDDRGFEPVARYQVADNPVWSLPAVIGRRIFVKDAQSLAAWQWR